MKMSGVQIDTSQCSMLNISTHWPHAIKYDASQSLHAAKNSVFTYNYTYIH